MEQEPKLDPSTITDVETAKLALRWAVEKIHTLQEDVGRLREDNRTKTSLNRSLTEQVEQKTEILKKWQGTIKTWEENWKTQTAMEADLKAKLREQHPDWVLTTDNGRECAETLNLANPQAARFFADTILRIIKGYKLDFYKLDYNVYTHLVSRLNPGYKRVAWGAQGHPVWPLLDVMPQYNAIQGGTWDTQTVTDLTTMRDQDLTDLNTRLNAMSAALEQITPQITALN